jgi:hypothetical protein
MISGAVVRQHTPGDKHACIRCSKGRPVETMSSSADTRKALPWALLCRTMIRPFSARARFVW